MAECCGHDPAFNTVGCDEASLSNGGCYTQTEGLSKREYFAARALQALVSNSSNNWASLRDEVARTAVEYADCLIRALDAN